MTNSNYRIPEIINNLVKKYIIENNGHLLTSGEIQKCQNAYDINDGLCADFAEDLINLLGGENDEQCVLSQDMFLADFYEEAVELWGEEDLIKTENGAAWSKKMLSLYSIPPVADIRLTEYLPAHVWIYVNSKHYDAENPNGVANPWELLIFKKYFEFILK